MLDRHSDLPEDAVSCCPGIYQCYVEKCFELRVTVIGEKIFAARLASDNGSAFLDWRPHIMDDELLVEPFDLPVDLEERVHDFMHKLGIVFGCFDFAVDAVGNIYFLEVNQQGQFLFIEKRQPSIPLLRAMTAMLCSGSADYSISDVVSVKLEDYMKTDAHKKTMDIQPERLVVQTVENL